MSVTPQNLVKNNHDTNAQAWLRETSIISYGVVTDVPQEGIVTVTQVVRDGTSIKTLTVPLLTFSSALAEEGAVAQEGDLVLLLFMDKTAPSMFDSAQARAAAQDAAGVTRDWTIFNRNAQGYTKFSAVGILLQPFKGLAATVTRHGKDESTGEPMTTFRTKAKIQKIFRREFNMLFDSLPDSSGFVDRLVQISFGQNSPFQLDHWAAVTKSFGLSINADGTLQIVNAPVVEKFSIYSPVTRVYEGTVSVTIGKGTPAGGHVTDSPTDTPSGLTVDIGAQADVTITTKSKVSLISGGVTYLIDTDGTLKVSKSSGTLLSLDASGNLSAAGDVIANAFTPATKVTLTHHEHPTAPMGPPSAPVPGL